MALRYRKPFYCEESSQIHDQSLGQIALVLVLTNFKVSNIKSKLGNGSSCDSKNVLVFRQGNTKLHMHIWIVVRQIHHYNIGVSNLGNKLASEFSVLTLERSNVRIYWRRPYLLIPNCGRNCRIPLSY